MGLIQIWLLEIMVQVWIMIFFQTKKELCELSVWLGAVYSKLVEIVGMMILAKTQRKNFD